MIIYEKDQIIEITEDFKILLKGLTFGQWMDEEIYQILDYIQEYINVKMESLSYEV